MRKLLAVIGILAVAMCINLAHSKLVYHNYRCAFAHCRIVQITK